MRKQVPPEKTKDVLEFATKKPHDRLNSIKNSLGVTEPTTFFYSLRRLNCPADLEVARVGVRQTVRPQGGTERGTVATHGSCFTTSDP